MLDIFVEKTEMYDEVKNVVMIVDETKVRLAHSLVSVSKWEAKTCKPFIVPERLERHYPKTEKDWVLYIECMLIGNYSKHIPTILWYKYRDVIEGYINHPHTATTITDRSKKHTSPKVVTSEEIYGWMIEYGIPFECEKWHLNSLMTLIKVRNVMLNPGKRSKGDIMAELIAAKK